MRPTKISFKVSELTQCVASACHESTKRNRFLPQKENELSPEDKLESAAVLFIEPHTH